MLKTINNYIGNSIGNEYVYLAILTLASYILIRLLTNIVCKIYMSFNNNARDRYMYKKKTNLISNIAAWIVIFFIWEPHLANLITLISFISAGATIALREIIFNFFSGMYIKIKKPFKLEDRIEIDGHKGDVVNISNLNFEILEIGDDINGEQSTGKIIHLPNSLIFTSPLKNYVKAFKYIWAEITVKIPLDSDLRESKKVLYKIVNNNQIVKRIPQKMRNQIASASLDYRIYFNKFEPIIYTRVVDDHIELYIRYLIHPKKSRNVEDEIWCSILNAYKNQEIVLYKI